MAFDTEWLSDDPVYLEKKKLIKEHQIAIWRFHDHMHMDVDDGIYRGFDEELDWGKYRVKCDGDLGWFGAVYELPPLPTLFSSLSAESDPVWATAAARISLRFTSIPNLSELPEPV